MLALTKKYLPPGGRGTASAVEGAREHKIKNVVMTEAQTKGERIRK